MSRQKPDTTTIREQASAFASELAEYRGEDLTPLWDSLRASHVPFIPILFRDELETAHALCNNVLRAIGRANVGAAYALENHLYVLGGIETYLSMHPNTRIRARLDDILARRQYVANTHGYLHTDSAFTEGISAKHTSGGMEVNGTGHFVSFAKTADLLFLTLVDCPDPTALLFPVKGDKHITFGEDVYFPEVLRTSDTRSMSCEGVAVSPEHVFDVPRDHLLPGGAISVVLLGWHLTLSSSSFLGGASYVIDQTLKFAKGFKAFDGRPLSRLDDVVAALGKIGIRYGAADALISDYTRSLAALSAGRDHAEVLRDGLLSAQIANCHATELSEEISRRCRGLLGTRIFGPRYATLARVTTELLLGPLAPRNNGILEKDVGHGMLAKRSFDGIRWATSRTSAVARASEAGGT